MIQGLGSWNQFLKISIWRLATPVSLEQRVSHSLLWIPFSRCRSSAAAAVQGSVSTEADGKCLCCCSVTGKHSWWAPRSWRPPVCKLTKVTGEGLGDFGFSDFFFFIKYQKHDPEKEKNVSWILLKLKTYSLQRSLLEYRQRHTCRKFCKKILSKTW